MLPAVAVVLGAVRADSRRATSAWFCGKEMEVVKGRRLEVRAKALVFHQKTAVRCSDVMSIQYLEAFTVY